jgi:streptogramin lyase
MLGRRAGTALALALIVSGCGGGAGKAVPAASSPRAPSSAHVTFTMVWNAAAPSSVARSPRYVPATARSVSVSVNSGTMFYLNSPATSLAIDAPVGTDTFVFQTYDEQNGQGNVLSHAAVSKTIVDGAANVVSASLNGVVASLAIALGAPNTSAGTANSIQVLATAKDADGNTIVGPSDYSVPISLAISDPANSGTLSLSTLSVANPSTNVSLQYSGGTLATASVVASAPGVSAVSAAITPTPTFYFFPLSNSSAEPFGITAGPDGNIWFTELGVNKIGRITPAGVISEFPVGAAVEPEAIAPGPDGRLWFTEYGGSSAGAITTMGQVLQYALTGGCVSEAVAPRADGTVWYGCDGGTVDVLAINGNSQGSATVGSLSFGIVNGPDNNMYVASFNSSSFSKLANVSNSPTTISTGTGSNPDNVVVGPDGAIWYTDRSLSRIGRISTASSSVTATYPTLTPNADPTGLTVGADGALWFTELYNGKIGRITTGGVVTEYTSPSGPATAFSIVSARDGSLWIANYSTSTIEKFVF